MYCPKDMRIVKAKEVAIPRNKDLFCRIGRRDVVNSFSDDDVPSHLSKIDSLLLLDEELGRQAAAQRQENGGDIEPQK